MTVKSKPTAQPSRVSQPTPQAVRRDGIAARDAQLVISRIEPWSVMKFTFFVSVVSWVILFVAVTVLYFVLSTLNVFPTIEQTIGSLTYVKGHGAANAASWFSAKTVIGYTLLAGGVNVIVITALATVGAVIYNLVTNLSGGIEITLQEAD
jgi:hypothetical protein